MLCESKNILIRRLLHDFKQNKRPTDNKHCSADNTQHTPTHATHTYLHAPCKIGT